MAEDFEHYTTIEKLYKKGIKECNEEDLITLIEHYIMYNC